MKFQLGHIVHLWKKMRKTTTGTGRDEVYRPTWFA